MTIKEPEGGTVTADGKTITADGANYATHVVIEPQSATPTPTAAPTPTPTPTATPTATPTPTPTPTAAPSATPTATPSATPTATPSATPTAAPSATPTATPSATPTATPSATPTAAPSATPTAAPSATPTAKPTAAPTVTPTPTPAGEYYTASGEGQNIERGKEGSFTVKNTVNDNKTFDNFRKALVDSKELTKGKDYDVARGSLVITLKAACLDTLTVGGHTLSVIFTDGRDDISFTVSAGGKPVDPTKFDDVAVPSDSFSFKKVWEGDSEDGIDFTLYKQGGEVYHHAFNKKVVNRKEWRYNAWFTSPAACYVIEKPVPGYITKYVNVGVYAQVTDRCCDGGTIINKKIPKTGDPADFVLWAGLLLLSAAGVAAAGVIRKRRKAQK